MESTLYILYSYRDYKTYVGSTSRELETRLQEHFNGLVKSTKNRRPLVLLYTENFPTLEAARKQESFYKTSWGRRKLKKIIDPLIKNLSGPVV